MLNWLKTMGKKSKEPEFDYDLLVETLSIQSYHKDNEDADMMEFIKEKSAEFGGKCTTDAYGNLYVTKGKSELYSCIVAHTDTVHDIVEGYSIFESEDILFAFSSKKMEQVGIGGDDKSGIFMALNALKDLPNLKCFFARHEEIGCKGSKQADMSFFDDCNIVLQADRRGNSGFVTIAAGVELSSDEFQKDISDILKQRQYKTINGSITDVMTLKERGLAVCAANIECGYYEPHSSREVVSISDSKDCYEMMVEIIERCKDKVYLHTYKPEVHYNPLEVKEKSHVKRKDDDNWYRDHYLGRGFRSAPGEIPYQEFSPSKSTVLKREDFVDEEASEEYLEEMDIIIEDLQGSIDDYILFRTTMKEKAGIM